MAENLHSAQNAEYVRFPAVVEKLAGVGPKVCFCCRACAMSSLTILARAGVEMRLIDGPRGGVVEGTPKLPETARDAEYVAGGDHA